MLTDLLLEIELGQKSWFRLTSSVLRYGIYDICIFPIEETGLSGKIHTHRNTLIKSMWLNGI